jgi:2-polyprenyl-3-methyl-5-hydroxy-6-metoxy-1,4-benzoquinol methylase
VPAPRLNDHLYVDRALAFAEHSERSPYNASYERPSMLRLVGDVAGKDVLDVGCGGGTLLALLAERKPRTLTGFDASPQLAAIAAARLAERARITVHDVREPFESAERNSIDVIVCSLVLDYVEDWKAALANCRSLLRVGGSMFFSVTHPNEAPSGTDANECVLVETHWPSFGLEVSYYHRPLSHMLGAIVDAGFVLRRTDEPKPATSLLWRDPGRFVRLKRRPRFLMFEIGNPAPPE